MKRKIFAILIVLSLMVFNTIINAQPDPGSGGGGSPVGGSAPIGSGIISLLCLGFLYGLMKIYAIRKRQSDK